MSHVTRPLIDRLNVAFWEHELEFRGNVRHMNRDFRQWWAIVHERPRDIDWRGQLDTFERTAAERGVRLDAGDMTRLREYLSDLESRHAFDRPREVEPRERRSLVPFPTGAFGLSTEEARRQARRVPARELYEGVPRVSDETTAAFDDARWGEILSRHFHWIVQYYDHDRWLAQAESTLRVFHPPQAWRERFLAAITSELAYRRLRESWTAELPRALAERDTTANDQSRSLFWRWGVAIDTFLADGDMAALVALFRELVEALPGLLHEALRGGDIESVLLATQRLLRAVADFLEALPREFGGVALDILQTMLDLVGLLPLVGEPLDVASAALSARRGEYLDAALSLAAVVPLAGMLAGTGKIVARLNGLAKFSQTLTGAAGRVIRELIEKLVAAAYRLLERLADLARRGMATIKRVFEAFLEVCDELAELLVKATDELIDAAGVSTPVLAGATPSGGTLGGALFSKRSDRAPRGDGHTASRRRSDEAADTPKEDGALRNPDGTRQSYGVMDDATRERVWDDYPPTERGLRIEDHVAVTEYAAWKHVGREKGGFYPLIDFELGRRVASLKTVDTRGTSWPNRLREHVFKLTELRDTVQYKRATITLDVRVQRGGEQAALDALRQICHDNKIVLRVAEF